jgi:hypothetical protein
MIGRPPVVSPLLPDPAKRSTICTTSAAGAFAVAATCPSRDAEAPIIDATAPIKATVECEESAIDALAVTMVAVAVSMVDASLIAVALHNDRRSPVDFALDMRFPVDDMRIILTFQELESTPFKPPASLA